MKKLKLGKYNGTIIKQSIYYKEDGIKQLIHKKPTSSLSIK